MFEFCGIVSNLLGSKAIDWSGIKTVDEDCNFTPLPYFVLITQIVIPIGIGIPAVFLIPNVYQTENLIDWANDLMAKACISNCFSNKYDIVFYSNKILHSFKSFFASGDLRSTCWYGPKLFISNLLTRRQNTYVLHTELSPQSPRSAHTELSPQSPRSAPLSRKKR